MKNKLTLMNLGGGQLQADVEKAFSKLCENIADPDTCPDEVRKLTITIEIQPDMKRHSAVVTYTLKSRQADALPGSTQVYLAMDEHKQLALFRDMTLADNMTFKEKTN